MMLSEQSESKHQSPWFVYIMQARTGRYYVGIAVSIEERLLRHNNGTGSRFARQQGPFKLKYKQAFSTKSLARKREIQLKGWTRDKKEKLISGLYR